jgi:hypothetical protein
MECERQLDHSEVGSDVAAVSGGYGDELVANFLRKTRELGGGKRFYVGWTLDGREKTRRRGSGGIVHQRGRRSG